MALDTSDITLLQKWPHTVDPFAAVKDHSKAKEWFRWLRPSHLRAHRAYWKRRAEWIGRQNFENYFATTDRTMDREKWEYLRLRKSWYQIPLQWEKFAGEDCRNILDIGCGDGDLTQTLADFIADYWEKNGGGHPLTIIGIDLSPTRIANAKEHCKAHDARITMEFHVGDATTPLPFPDQCFDYSLNSGVFEILEDASATKLAAELCRVTRKGIYTEDLADHYPGGFPREDLTPLFAPHGFRFTARRVVLTEPFSRHANPRPCAIWPILRDQIVWAERCS